MQKNKYKMVKNLGVYANRFWINDSIKFKGGYGEIQKVYYCLDDFKIYYGLVDEVTNQSVLVADNECQDLQPSLV